MSSSPPAPGKRFHGRLARTMLIIFLLLTTVPLAILGGTAYLRARALFRDQISNLLLAVVNAQGANITERVLTGQLLLSQAIYDPEVAEGIEEALGTTNHQDQAFISIRQTILDELQLVNQPKPFFNQILIVSPDGQIQLATNRDWEGKHIAPTLLPQTSDPTSKQAVSKASQGFEPLYLPDQMVIFTTVPFIDKAGKNIATVMGFAESPTIRDLMSNSVFYTTNHYFYTPSGKFVGINPYPNSLNKLVEVAPPQPYQQALQQGLSNEPRQGTLDLVSNDQQPVIASYTWLPTVDLGWIAEVPQSSVYGQLNALLVFGLILLSILLVVVALITWQSTQRLVRPILQLSDTVRLFAEGNWEQRVPEDRDDEIGQLASSFNHMADELTGLYHSLESKVEERTYQIRTTAEATQIASNSTSMEELLQRTIQLIVDRFAYSYAGFYVVDESRNTLELRQVGGSAHADATAVPERSRVGYKVKIDPLSLIGWVAGSNRARTNATADRQISPSQQDLLPDTLAEAVIPVSVGEQVFGVLDIQSSNPAGFSEEAVAELQTLANQIAPALQNYYLLEATQVNLRETNLLYQASHQIARAETEEQIFQAATQALQQTPYAYAFLAAVEDGFKVIAAPDQKSNGSGALPAQIAVPPVELVKRFSTASSIVISEAETNLQLPRLLRELPRQMKCDPVALLPVTRSGRLAMVLVLGIQQRPGQTAATFSPAILQPYISLAELITTAFEKVQALKNINKRLVELQTLSSVSQAVAVETQLDSLYRVIHEQITQVMGDVSFLIALYDHQTNIITIPYIFEKGELITINPFPLGQGLTSILIRTKQPLLLVENTAEKTRALGAIQAGAPAKSWLGVPLLLAGEAIGAIVVQDVDQEHRFNEDDQQLLTTLAAQVAVVVRNARLLENTRRLAERERLLYEITNKIRRSTDMETILQTTTDELAKALGTRRASIEINVEELLPTRPGTTEQKEAKAEE